MLIDAFFSKLLIFCFCFLYYLYDDFTSSYRLYIFFVKIEIFLNLVYDISNFKTAYKIFICHNLNLYFEFILIRYYNQIFIIYYLIDISDFYILQSWIFSYTLFINNIENSIFYRYSYSYLIIFICD